MMEAKPRCWWMLLLIAILFLEGWWSLSTTDACWEPERIALLHLKPFFNYYHDLKTWVDVKSNYNSSSHSDCCDWERIECNSITGHVISLSLNYTATWDDYIYLNTSLFLPFEELKYLDLSNNGIAGFVEKGEVDKWFPTVNDLETLDLSGNFFKNDMLAHVNVLSSLKSLSLGNNLLEGKIHIHELNNLTKLKYLDLSTNRIESLLPTNEALRLTNLEELDLSGNLLSDDTISFLRGLSNLKSLNLEGNQFGGSIDLFKGLQNLANLRKLNLAQNKLESFQLIGGSGRQLRLTYLKELDLSGNLLNTSVFASLGQLSNLKILYLSGNKLEGSIDIRKGWCELSNLKELYMDGNALQGMLPSCLGNLTSLGVLDISDNQFTGNLSPLANVPSLWYLSLSKNNLQVPMSFLPLTNLTNLKFLLLDQNKLVMEPLDGFHASLPMLQLNVLSLSNCTTDQQLMKEPPQFLYHQHDLRIVDLSHNNLSGSIPTWLLQNNPNLEQLFLMSNSFTGPLLLPPLPNLNLSTFDISKNKVQGQIPTNICSTFPYLLQLILSENEFKGYVPSCLGGIRTLRILDLSNNQLFGEIPEELIMIDSLWILKLSNNNLSGKLVPEIFTSNSALEYLNLDGNNFVGEMPDIDISTYDLPLRLEGINLSNNNLSGELPRWIWNLSALGVLALSNNHFEGSIPIDSCNLENLLILDLSHNNLSGPMPSCLNQGFLKHVHLNGNKLSGPLIEALPNSSSLVTLDLSRNNFIGSIPEWIDQLSSLSVLVLKANHLDGGIPNQLCNLDSLTILDLSGNMFSGPIPSCLGDLTLSTSFDKFFRGMLFIDGKYESIKEDFTSNVINEDKFIASHQYLIMHMEELVEFTTKSGSYLYKGEILNYMSGIDLSCNKLIGHIPFELGNLSGIHALNLSHNNLTGVIPSSFSNLKDIESVDLSYNNLRGKIPMELVVLNSLEVFSVAHNNLSGSTPERKAQFGTFDESSYEGNPLLCGPPLHNSCSHTGSSPTILATSDAGEEDGLLDMYVFCVTFLVCYVVVLLVIAVVLYINPYWRRRWLLFIEDFIDTCRYSALGNFLALYIFSINAWKCN